MTIGLAVRKAIAYAINSEEINDVLFGGEKIRVYHPLHPSLGVWLNTTIIRYDHSLSKAREYMAKAGFEFTESDPLTSTILATQEFRWWVIVLIVGSIVLSSVSISLILMKRRRKQREENNFGKDKA